MSRNDTEIYLFSIVFETYRADQKLLTTVTMWPRFLILVNLCGYPLFSQYSGLSATDDGVHLYFSSGLVIHGSDDVIVILVQLPEGRASLAA